MNILVICLLFFLSGFSGLLYQIVWIKELKLVIGTSFYSITTVVSVFMGGLALGSVLGGKLEKRKNPFKLYGIFEICIGLYALILPVIVRTAYPGTVFFTKWIPYYIWRFVFATGILLIPTILMGATFPLIIAAVSKEKDFLQRFSLLYGCNTAGGMTGALLCAFYIIPSAGLFKSSAIGAAVSILVGISALLIRVPVTNQDMKHESKIYFDPLLVAALFLSGFGLLHLEICFTDYASLIIGSSTYSFAVILAVYLAGIAAGAFLAGKIFRDVSIQNLMTGAVFFTAAMTVFLWTASFFPYAYMKLKSLYVKSFLAESLLNIVFISVIVVIPVTAGSVIFPVLSARFRKQAGSDGKAAAYAYFINTCGCIAGVVAAGFFSLRNFGLLYSFKFSVIVIACGPLLICVSKKEYKKCAALLAVLILFCVPVFLWSDQVICSGVFYRFEKYDSLKNFRDFYQALNANELLFHETGPAGTVSVIKDPEKTVLKINGKSDASTDVRDLCNNVLLAHIPAILCEKKENVLVVGFASGVTVNSLQCYENIKVDCVEISPEVCESAPFFESVNNTVYKNPEVNIIVDDGRNFILNTQKKYDIIISEPSNPWLGDVSNLFTREYFQGCSDILNDSGICVVWIQLYELPENLVYSVMATVKSVFPYVSVWKTDEGNIALTASKNTFRISVSEIEKQILRKPVSEDLGRYHISSAEGFLMLNLFLDVSPLIPPGTKILTDDNVILEYSAPKGFYTGKTVNLNKLYSARGTDWSAATLIYDVAINDFDCGMHEAEYGYVPLAKIILENVVTRFPDNAVYWKEYGRLLRKLGMIKESIEPLKKSYELVSQGETAKMLADSYFVMKEYEQALLLYTKIAETDSDPHADAAAGRIYEIQGNRKKAEFYYKKAFELDPENPSYALSLMLFYDDGGKIARVSEYARIIYANPKASYELKRKVKEFR